MGFGSTAHSLQGAEHFGVNGSECAIDANLDSIVGEQEMQYWFKPVPLSTFSLVRHLAPRDWLAVHCLPPYFDNCLPNFPRNVA